MRRVAAALLAIAALGAGCGSSDGPQDRIVRVDHRNDEFASYYWRYFPQTIEAHPGDTLVFRTEWTGEPHTVTFGTLVDRALPRVDALDRKYADLDESGPADVVARAEREYAEALEGLPRFEPYGRGQAAQNAVQPCYLRTGAPPTEPDRPCPAESRRPEPFDGRHTYYSSGFIVPEGPTGSEFRMPIARDTEPGEYRYYCVIHFNFMVGRLIVRPADAEVPSQADVNRRAQREIEALAAPLREAYEAAHEGTAEYAGEAIDGPIAGYHAGDEFTAAIGEFVPRTIVTEVGEPVSWTVIGAHTISFDVPRYVPIYLVDDDGTVRRNPVVDGPAGGAPDPGPVDFTRPRLEIDAGTWDGDGFFSSGLLGSERTTFTMRFGTAGRYRLACLVHPPMVGTVIVNG